MASSFRLRGAHHYHAEEEEEATTIPNNTTPSANSKTGIIATTIRAPKPDTSSNSSLNNNNNNARPPSYASQEEPVRMQTTAAITQDGRQDANYASSNTDHNDNDDYDDAELDAFLRRFSIVIEEPILGNHFLHSSTSNGGLRRNTSNNNGEYNVVYNSARPLLKRFFDEVKNDDGDLDNALVRSLNRILKEVVVASILSYKDQKNQQTTRINVNHVAWVEKLRPKLGEILELLGRELDLRALVSRQEDHLRNHEFRGNRDDIPELQRMLREEAKRSQALAEQIKELRAEKKQSEETIRVLQDQLARRDTILATHRRSFLQELILIKEQLFLRLCNEDYKPEDFVLFNWGANNEDEDLKEKLAELEAKAKQAITAAVHRTRVEFELKRREYENEKQREVDTLQATIASLRFRLQLREEEDSLRRPEASEVEVQTDDPPRQDTEMQTDPEAVPEFRFVPEYEEEDEDYSDVVLDLEPTLDEKLEMQRLQQQQQQQQQIEPAHAVEAHVDVETQTEPDLVAELLALRALAESNAKIVDQYKHDLQASQDKLRKAQQQVATLEEKNKKVQHLLNAANSRLKLLSLTAPAPKPSPPQPQSPPPPAQDKLAVLKEAIEEAEESERKYKAFTWYSFLTITKLRRHRRSMAKLEAYLYARLSENKKNMQAYKMQEILGKEYFEKDEARTDKIIHETMEKRQQLYQDRTEKWAMVISSARDAVLMEPPPVPRSYSRMLQFSTPPPPPPPRAPQPRPLLLSDLPPLELWRQQQQQQQQQQQPLPQQQHQQPSTVSQSLTLTPTPSRPTASMEELARDRLMQQSSLSTYYNAAASRHRASISSLPTTSLVNLLSSPSPSSYNNNKPSTNANANINTNATAASTTTTTATATTTTTATTATTATTWPSASLPKQFQRPKSSSIYYNKKLRQQQQQQEAYHHHQFSSSYVQPSAGSPWSSPAHHLQRQPVMDFVDRGGVASRSLQQLPLPRPRPRPQSAKTAMGRFNSGSFRSNTTNS